jgi:hypothetical protein
LEVAPLVGLVVSRVLPTLTFSRQVTASNTLWVGGDVGPFYDFGPLPEAGPLVEPAAERIVRALTVIQKPHQRPHPRAQLLGPLSGDFQAIRRAASLIAGNIVMVVRT